MHLKAFEPTKTRAPARPLSTLPNQTERFASSKTVASNFVGQPAIFLEMQMPAFHTPVIGSAGCLDRHLPAALPWADPSVLVGEPRGDRPGEPETAKRFTAAYPNWFRRRAGKEQRHK